MAKSKPKIRKSDQRLRAFVQEVTAALLAGRRHRTPGLGTFSTCTRKATTERAACRMAMFRASDQLRGYACGGMPPVVSGPYADLVCVIVEAMQDERGVDVPLLGRLAVVPVPGKKPRLIFHGNDALNQQLATTKPTSTRLHNGTRLRHANPADAPAITECVHLAYAHWVPKIGQTPGPMLQNYAEKIRSELVIVAEVSGRIAGVLVLSPTDEGYLLDNVAVAPVFVGQGIGKALLIRAELEAQSHGYDSVYLYTHEKMAQNIALYSKNGYVEYARREESGFRRVFMRKTLRDGAK